MTPIQQLFLGQGAKKKTYLDDVFSTYLYTGDDSSYRNINNGIDLAGEGGMVWVRPRNNTIGFNVFDTVRGASKRLHTDASYTESTDTSRLDQFNSNGFRVNGNYSTNGPSSYNYASYSFRRASGFFDCVTWDGNNTNPRQIAHHLNCVPGLILIKCIENAYGMSDQSWNVYHRSLTNSHYLKLDTNVAKVPSSNFPAEPTATHFTVGYNYPVNFTGAKYVAYLFGGGESDAATARSIKLDGSDDYLSIDDSNGDLASGTSDFTLEMWIKPTSWNSTGYLYSATASNGFYMYKDGTNFKVGLKDVGVLGGAGDFPKIGVWTHIAFVRHSNAGYIYFNGELKNKINNVDYGSYASGTVRIGVEDDANGGEFPGYISNYRFVNGTAVYTSSFKPPTEPLTNITNTKLLCCNSSSTTGSTVTPGTITANSTPTTSTDSPFDDPAAFTFGDNEDQNVVSTGSYEGNGNADGPEIFLGWEPSFVLTKNADISDEWYIFDSMRGIVSGGHDPRLSPNSTGAESSGDDRIDLTPTGFKIKNNNGDMNGNGDKIVFLAIRRSDPLVQKPAELGTDVFGMDLGTASGSPKFISNFPVDFATIKLTNGADNWYTSARLMQGKGLYTNTSAAEYADSTAKFDFNNGYYTGTLSNSAYMGWMWKRHAGFDVVTDTSAQWVRHSLNRVPEMVIIKDRIGANSWFVWHKDLNGGGSNSIGYFLGLNSNSAEANWGNVCPIGDTLPTATHFQSDSDSAVRNANCIAFLFASVEGISKLGSYTGNATSGHAITGLGFQPRFLIIKCTSTTTNWAVLDTSRGWGSGNDKLLRLNMSDAQIDYQYGAPTSDGFTIAITGNDMNGNGEKYIYYAHA